MIKLADVRVPKTSDQYQEAIGLVVQVMRKRNGRFFDSTVAERTQIADSVPSGYNVFEIIFNGMTKYKNSYGRKHLR